jgi:hypothetical protein
MTITTRLENLREPDPFVQAEGVTLSHYMGKAAAEKLGMTREIRQGEWRGKHEKLKKGEHEPGVLAYPRTLSVWWKSGALILYLDLYYCIPNQQIDDCVMVGTTFVDEPPQEQIDELLDLWDMKSVRESVQMKREILATSPGYRRRTSKTPQKRVAPRDE